MQTQVYKSERAESGEKRTVGSLNRNDLYIFALTSSIAYTNRQATPLSFSLHSLTLQQASLKLSGPPWSVLSFPDEVVRIEDLCSKCH